MENNFLDLYHERILKLDKDPYHFEKHDLEPYVVAINPLCGDRFKIYRKLDDNIQFYSFYGHGCAVSKASTSLLVKMLEENQLEDALKMAQKFVDFIENPESHCPLPELEIFSKVKLYPARMECATLAWKALIKKSMGEPV